jgi:serine/threonine protein phosphatase PrpC
VFAVPVRPGDRIVQCTDGVWGFVEDRDIADFAAAESSMEGFNRAVMDAAIRGGSDDNLSLLSLRFGSLAGAPEPGAPESTVAGLFRRWFRR